MSFDKETLFRLLPAFDRIRDHELANPVIPSGATDEIKDGPVKALLGLIAEQLAVLEENMEQLYDDQFIETCAEWVVPYIGELVSTRGLVVFPDAPFSQRAQVANTIAYRRRKGTATVLEQLARDVTGWTSSAVEYFQLLATTQYLNHLRPENLSLSGLKNWEQMEYVNTPFDKLARTADVRRVESKRGKYNIPNIGIFLWRLDAYSSIKSPAYKVDARRYKFDALGKDIQLFTNPVREPEISHLAQPINVPAPIRRLVLRNYPESYYGPGMSLLIYRDGIPVYTSPAAPGSPASSGLSSLVSICNLSDVNDGTGDWHNMPQDKIAIDPVLGRIAFPVANPPSVVHVDYHYGFSDKMSGGDYDRIASFSPGLENRRKILVPDDKPTITAALADLQNLQGIIDSNAIIEITDNEIYVEAPVIRIAAGKKLEIRGANAKRPILLLTSDLLIFGQSNAEVSINGLLINGHSLRLPFSDSSGMINQLGLLKIEHCTLVPPARSPISSPPNNPVQPSLIAEIPDVEIIIKKSIIGFIRIHEEADAEILNSIIDAGDEKETAYAGTDSYYGAPLKIENATIIGKCTTRIMKLASNTVFYTGLGFATGDAAPVEAQRLQEGCVRFSYVPPGSRLPRLYECQPSDPNQEARIRPLFNSLEYGKADYCQLSQHCAIEIRHGGDNGAEMGAFHNLYQPQRESNLRTRLDEYMRFGLEAGIFYGS